MDIKLTSVGKRYSQFKHSFINRLVIGVYKDKIYCSSGVNLQSSSDGGKTWSNEGVSTSAGTFSNVYTTQRGTVLAFAQNPSRLFRLVQGGEWEEVIVSEDEWTHPFPQGVGSNGDTIIFGEWTIKQEGVCRLFMSTDGGLTWSVKMGLNIPEQIRHFHTCQYFGEGIWIATSGDYSSGYHYTDQTSGQVEWYVSRDNGETFNSVGGLDQRHRTLYMHLQGGTDLLWTSDAVPGKQFGAVYKAPLSNPLDVEVVFALGKTSWGIAGDGVNYIAVTSLEPGDEDNLTGAYSSTDGGNTWQLESYHRAKEGDNFVGFRFPMGPDRLGNFYVQTNSLGYLPGGHSEWRATTIFNINS